MKQRTLITGALVTFLLVLYSPTLYQTFDFEDDGDNIYSSGNLSTRLSHIWNQTVTESLGRGPFRPVFWAYYEFNGYFFSINPVTWRWVRLGSLELSAILFLFFMLDLGLPLYPSAIAVALSFIMPMRSEIWYHFAFGEGTAMPFVFLSLIAARRAARGQNSLKWDGVGITCMLIALLTKNVFMACLPVQVLLRIWPDHLSLSQGLKGHWKAGSMLSSLALLPLSHLVFFKLRVEAVQGEYHASLPTWHHVDHLAKAIMLASGKDFLYVGMGVLLFGVIASSWTHRTVDNIVPKRAWITGILLAVLGYLVYLPNNGVAGRYTVPACWGLDILLASLLSAFSAIHWLRVRQFAAGSLVLGAMAMLLSHQYQLQVFKARSQVLWDTVQWLIQHAPPNAQVGIIEASVWEPEAMNLGGHVSGLGRRDISIAMPSNSWEPNLGKDIVLASRPSPPQPVRGFPRFVLAQRFDVNLQVWSWVPKKFRSKREHGVVIYRREP